MILRVHRKVVSRAAAIADNSVMENPTSSQNPPLPQISRLQGSAGWAAALIVCVLAAYANCPRGVFHLDDVRSIERNESLRDLSQPGRLFGDTENVTRPVVALTFAIDYAFFRLEPAGYHAFNLAAHLAAALLLFGVIRRSLLSEKLRARFGSVATPLAFSAALIWALHPLQTEAVTYVVQRAESMMGMFFLLAFYCAIRGADSNSQTAWHSGAIAAAALGAGCKQVIAVLPIVFLLYDRCFISGTFKAAWKRAPFLHAGLCVSWLVIVVLLKMVPNVGSAGFGMEKIKPLNYACSEFVVIVHYLRLALWPAGLCLDYAWNIERDPSRIVPCAALVLGLVGATLWQLRKNTAAGFCGAWFFLILAPTSSIMPIADLAVEHRMYLSLAALAVLAVTGIYTLMQSFLTEQPQALRLTVAVFVVVGVALGTATFFRNTIYAGKLAMMEDIIAKRPDNPRAYSLVAMDALENHDNAKALEYIDKAVALRPNLPETHLMKGHVLLTQKDYAGAIASFQTALKITPQHAGSWVGLYRSWAMRDKDNAAIQRAGSMLAQLPLNPAIHLNMGSALAGAGRFDDAIFEFNEVLLLQPENEGAIFNRGKAYELSGREAGAVESYRAALRENPNRLSIANALAWLLAASANDKLRNGAEAVTLAEASCAQTQNKHPLMLDTLAAAYAESGQFEKAIATAETALKLAQAYPGLAKEIQAHLALFKSGKPYRDKKN